MANACSRAFNGICKSHRRPNLQRRSRWSFPRVGVTPATVWRSQGRRLAPVFPETRVVMAVQLTFGRKRAKPQRIRNDWGRQEIRSNRGSWEREADEIRVRSSQSEKIVDAVRGRYQWSGNDPFNIPAHAQLCFGNIGRSRLNLE